MKVRLFITSTVVGILYGFAVGLIAASNSNHVATIILMGIVSAVGAFMLVWFIPPAIRAFRR